MFENFHKVSSSYDPEKVEWRNYKDLNNKDFKIDFDYCLLGFDIENGRLDMRLRYPEGESHCRRHRHVASTLTLVLQGEQFLTEINEDGSKTLVHRKQGDYALAQCKMMLGEARSKFNSLPGAQGNVSMNGADLKNEAQTAIEKLEREIETYGTGEDPLTFVIG